MEYTNKIEIFSERVREENYTYDKHCLEIFISGNIVVGYIGDRVWRPPQERAEPGEGGIGDRGIGPRRFARTPPGRLQDNQKHSMETASTVENT